MMNKSRENYIRLSGLIISYGRDVLIELLEYFIKSKGMGFQDFLQIHAHDILHLCFSNILCCRCHGHVLVTRWKLMIQQLDQLLDKSGRKLPGHIQSSETRIPYCCSPVRSDISIKDVDLFTLQILLVEVSTVCSETTKKAIEELITARNLLRHKVECEISKDEFRRMVALIEGDLLTIADVYGKREEVTTNIKGVLERKFSVIQEELKNVAKSAIHRTNSILRGFAKSVNQQNVTQIFKMNSDTEFLELLSKGTYKSYENRVYLAGPCNSGKSAIACILIGDDVLNFWRSTNGLMVYFGRNGIDLRILKMIPLKTGREGQSLIGRVLCGTPDVGKIGKKRKLPLDENPPDYISVHETCKIPEKSTEGVINPAKIGKYSKMQEKILQEVRKGEYKVEIAPSDLTDFGGQRCFDMTHPLFVQFSGTFLLTLDCRKNLNDPLEEYPDASYTTASILTHWVTSILMYSKSSEDKMPQIRFVATHKDEFKGDLNQRKVELIKQLTDLFLTHSKSQHIKYDELFLINATDANDEAIEELKDELVRIATSQKSWGSPMPMAWVPIDLELSRMRSEGISMVLKEQIFQLDKQHEDLAIGEKQIEIYLKAQHSFGKILYFDHYGLDNTIILQPSAMVNVLRAFITDRIFWPKDQKLAGILETFTESGKIKKEDIFRLWEDSKLDNIMPDDASRHFVIDLLMHLDILIPPKNYMSEIKGEVDLFLVPCVVNRIGSKELLEGVEEKAICLSYSLNDNILPAFYFKLIGALLSIWPVKETMGKLCIYQNSVIFSVDELNDLFVWKDDKRISLYLINEKSKYHISPDVAASVHDCLTLALRHVLYFYSKYFAGSKAKSDLSKDFEVEVGVLCQKHECWIPLTEAKKKASWICRNGLTHDTKYPLYWIFDKDTKECRENCTGCSEEVLSIKPDDKHLVRLASLVGYREFHLLMLELGMKQVEWEDNEQMFERHGPLSVKTMALHVWRTQQDEPTLMHLQKGLGSSHYLCEIFREDTKLQGIADSKLQEVPSDDVLNRLPKQVGNCTVNLGIELGLSFSDVKETIHRHWRDIYSQTYDILKKWKQQSKSPATIYRLMQALQRVDSGGLKFLREIYK